MAGGTLHWTVKSLRGLRELSHAAGGDLYAMADASGLPRADINRALDACLGRTSDEELANAVTWLSGGVEPSAAARPQSRGLSRFIAGLLR